MKFKAIGVALIGLLGLMLSAEIAHADQIVWAMAGGGNGRLYEINVQSNSTALIGSIRDPVLGDVGSGWSTVAETPDKTLYFMRRYQSDVYVYALDSTNIHTTAGVIDNLQTLGATGLGGNLDGLTAGPDGNIYLTAYDNSNPAFARNGLYRFNPITKTLEFVGTFANDRGPGGANSFYTDLAFDPITGDLFGTGYAADGSFGIYRLSGAAVLNGTNQLFTFNKVFGAWGADGIAFDRLTGQMFESSDFGGVAEVDRNTGAFKAYLGGTGGSEIGTDLAVQADTIPTTVPEPSSFILLGSALLGLAGYLPRKLRR